jgi:hypothetical protein
VQGVDSLMSSIRYFWLSGAKAALLGEKPVSISKLIYGIDT